MSSLFFKFIWMLGIGYCLAVSLFLRYLPGYVILNRQPFGLNLSDELVLGIFAVTNLFIFGLRLPRRYPWPAVLILIGVWSNLIERLIFKNVADYLPFIISTVNVADIAIWSGLLWLNSEVLFGKQPSPIVAPKAILEPQSLE